MVQDPENQHIRMRARSNSADSWAAAMQKNETIRKFIPEQPSKEQQGNFY